MRSHDDAAAGFSITGLLDSTMQTRERFPVEEVLVANISDHPANVAYSMDETDIASLAQSIKENGLTDLPLVRRLDDGSLQMISGHRRKAAYALLAKEDDTYLKMPCRIIEGIDDTQAVTLLHTANYFVRALTVTERAAATVALGIEVKRLKQTDAAYAHMRAADIKADIISNQTGRKVSGKTILREEKLARQIASDLIAPWAAHADCGNLTAAAVESLCALSASEQETLFYHMPKNCTSKRDMSDYVRRATSPEHSADPRLLRALKALASFADSAPKSLCAQDSKALAEIASVSSNLVSQDKSPKGRRAKVSEAISSK